MACATENMTEMRQEMIPRSYQTQLMRIAKAQNSIIYLPTGSGKTYVAMLLLKEMIGPLQKDYSEGGKIGIMLVNTVPLVEQHAETIAMHTDLRVGALSGEMNVDFWIKKDWDTKCKKNNMFIMTGKILENALKQKYIDLNRIHVLIFDECHHATEAHTMREIMKEFEHALVPPRVLGLTATLLNKNVSSFRVLEEVTKLEVSLHSKVASVDDIDDVYIHSTNPSEYVEEFEAHEATQAEKKAIAILLELQEMLEVCHRKETKEAEEHNYRGPELSLFAPPGTYKELNQIVKDTIYHIEILGTYGGHRAIAAHFIQLQYIKLKCMERNVLYILKVMMTQFRVAKKLLEDSMKNKDTPELKILNNSSEQVIKFLYILNQYSNSKLPLCSLVFVERRFTAQILYHILKEMALTCDSYSHIQCEYVTGFQANPTVNSRFGLYEAKTNKSIIAAFKKKNLNLLVCTNIMEEGVDIPACSLVVKFDHPNNYRSYVQSKGRTRHREGKYVIMIKNTMATKYYERLQSFQEVENQLNSHLVNGKAALRPGPSSVAIKDMYNELELPTYYVDGPQSAHVSMNDAVTLIHVYCSSIPSDQFTRHDPIWFIEEHKESGKIRVRLEFPTIISHVVDVVMGTYMWTKDKAKQACALEACIMLHQMGELNHHLNPSEHCAIDANTDFLFTHWPETKESEAGNTKKRRPYKRMVPTCMLRPLPSSLTSLHLHVVRIEPKFVPDTTDLPALHFHRMYSSDVCFGLLTADAMPKVCAHPLYISHGEILVSIDPNVQRLELTQEQLEQLNVFHHLVFNGVLGILTECLSMKSDPSMVNLLVVPVNRQTGDIQWDIVQEHKNIKPMDHMPSSDEVDALDVTDDTYLDKIVTKCYGGDKNVHLVLFLTDLYPTSPFKTDDFGSFNDYYRVRYNMEISNQKQPLLLVKAISKRLNCLKPRGESSSRKRNSNGEGCGGKKEIFAQELVPEFLIKQDFPAQLWIQAKVMPSIIHRLLQLLRAEELRQLIAEETGMGQIEVEEIKPLTLDIHLVKNAVEPEAERQAENEVVEEKMEVDFIKRNKCVPRKATRSGNNLVFEKKLDDEYPWKAIEEPVDIHRNLDVTIADIKQYYGFINFNVEKMSDRLTTRFDKKPAITFDKDFSHKNITILNKSINSEGPDLRDIFQVLAAKHGNEIVNLERLETLGDSFLKLAASLYIWLKYPEYCEGKASTLKGKLISNKNLYYCAVRKNLGSLMLVSDLEIANWLPPSFGLLETIRTQLARREIQAGSLFHLRLTPEEQISGTLTERSQLALVTLNEVELKEDDAPPIDNYLGLQEVPDKTISDCVEATLGAYCQSCGFEGGLRMLEWFAVIPSTENLTELLKAPIPSPIIAGSVKGRDADVLEVVDNLLPNWEHIEESIGYHFKNRAYLLQALTHATYTNNRITRSYERLEFIGDAVLDYLITMYIYEYGNNLNPGELTDLRSALVNNETFAAFTVRLGLHKSLKYMNILLQSYIEKYVKYMHSCNYDLNSNMLIFINDGDVNSAENIDVPKALGDIFESVVGAIYLDCGMDMHIVWKIVYKIMYKEIDLFSACVPKNPVRLLYETPGAYPVFSKSEMKKDRQQVMMPLEVTVNADRKLVHGYGANKKLAKKAAAKIALCLFDKK